MGSSFNILSNNSVSISGVKTTSYPASLYLKSSSNNNLISNTTITNSGDYYALYLDSVNNNSFENCVINAPSAQDIYIVGTNSYTNYIINSTFNQSDVGFSDENQTDKIEVQWYLDIYVNSSSGKPINQANVTGSQQNGSQAFSELTASNGYLRQTLTEYSHNASQVYPENVTYYTPYTINASKEGYHANSTEINLTQSLAIYLTLEGIPPVINWIVPANDNSTVVNGTLVHNITFEDEYLYLVKCVIYNSTGGIVWESEVYNLTGNTSWTLTDMVNVSNWTDGIYYENCTVTDLD